MISLFLGVAAVEGNSVLGVRYMTIALSTGALLLLYCFKLLRDGKQVQAGAVFLWVTTFVISYAAWVGGGLLSISIVCFPVLLLFAGLFAEAFVFFSVGSFLVGVVVYLGMMDVLDTSFNPIEALVPAEARLGGFVSILLTSGFCGWTFGRDMRGAFKALNSEHQLVVESQAVIQELAYKDALTGLLNRAAAKEAYEIMLTNINFNEERIAFYFIDLDNFKVINDLFDHEAGDQLLITIANRLQRLTRQEDIACRLGGDEFVVFVRAKASFDFDGLAQRAMSAVAQPHYILGAEAEVTASIGIALVSEKGLSFDEVRKKSDMAMYKAKQSGKNKYHYYSESLHTEYMKSLNVLNGLKDALSEGFLDLYFQPQINLETNKIDSAEALLRWNRGNPYGFNPDDFIPVIESTELIHDIGAWVIQEACRACKKWHEQGHHISIAVNVSALQITRFNFYSIVEDALKESGLDANFLEIELTEHVLLTENMEVRSRLKALKDLGIKLAIDDFGTGYSNMNYLTRLRVDVLKLDKSFISEINVSKDSRVIVTAIIEMANVLGMQVIAEGVESIIQRNTLRELGCGLGQGFLWSKALPNLALLAFLDSSLKSGYLKVLDDYEQSNSVLN
ncbi:putative bifunctional diguanylate cyclase/phosphodiesterase [Leucothrix arctica]|uniref:putative bifunctional diguanylate cyclase/phosphodiesterase n=1 Tax=Leucothrix arctica TaxID=1481894 RepID=UPI001304D7F6|nr:GGDEF domain-containing phosphodiesterase [Leucothrix arctica]